jgi:hypothetical protein
MSSFAHRSLVAGTTVGAVVMTGTVDGTVGSLIQPELRNPIDCRGASPQAARVTTARAARRWPALGALTRSLLLFDRS